MQCELSLQEVQKILVELQHNGEKALKLEGGLDTETPHITTRIEIGNRKSVQVFGGLQAPNNILFDVKTSYQTSNEVSSHHSPHLTRNLSFSTYFRYKISKLTYF